MSSTALAGAVELLDRSLGYARPALAAVRPEHLARATPCRHWPLAVLLAHLDDGLDAWTEAATGQVSLLPTTALSTVASIRAKACGLLGWWLDHPPERVDVGDLLLPSETLVAAAALEVATHGWDVHATVHGVRPVPPELSGPLLAVAHHVVPDDRDGCFAPPVPAASGATQSQALMAFLGRT